MKLAAESVTVDRGGRTVLAGVSLSFEAGCTAVVGPNGAGKTTLLQTLLGLLRPARGRVTLDGRDIRSIPRRQIAQRVAYVPQIAEGLGAFTVEEFVASARFAHRHRLEPFDNHDRQVVAGAMSRCELAGLERRFVDALSGGERQRVLLAATIAQQAGLLLLDEPSAALDAKHQIELVSLIRSLEAGGCGVVLVAHDLNLAAALCDRVVALRGGAIAYDGPTGDFVNSQTLRDVFDAPFVLTPTADSPRPIICPRMTPP